MKLENATIDCIRTNSGLLMNVFEPTQEMICIEDIAHALGRMPRFGGHLNKHYSVAQHSIMCFNRAKNDEKLAALLHDASEAYMLDMPTPIKNRLPEYKKYEHNLMLVIGKKFGFDYPMSDNLKAIDKEMLDLEWDNLVITSNKNFKTLSAKKAKKEFLKAFYSLTTNE